MEVTGLSSSAFLSLWTSRGADENAIENSKDYYAYELAGYYAFSPEDRNEATINQLRNKVKLLVEDAPALQDRINPDARRLKAMTLPEPIVKTAMNAKRSR